MHEQKVWATIESMNSVLPITQIETPSYYAGLMTFQSLSNFFEEKVKLNLPNNISYEQAWHNTVEYKQFILPVAEELGYELEPQYLFSALIKKIESNDITFDVMLVESALRNLENSSYKFGSNEAFAHLFDDVDLKSNLFGKTNEDHTIIVGRILRMFSTLKLNGEFFSKILDMFSRRQGRAVTITSSPTSIQKLFGKILTYDKSQVKSVYNPTCGTGQSSLYIGKEVEVEKYYGQELNSQMFNLARMNMLIHGINYRRFSIKSGDALLEPKHKELKFEVIVSEPPFGMHWLPSRVEGDIRFEGYGKLAPKSRADLAYIQHMIYHLSDTGTMAVIVPHGALFRGGSESLIRQHLIERKNYLDAVIGLPAGLHYSTSIPTCLLIFSKKRLRSNEILFIDASNTYLKDHTRNVLNDEHIKKIVETYANYENVDRYASVISMQEIKENEYNLNISRYVDTTVEKEPLDVEIIERRLAAVKSEIQEINLQLEEYIKQLSNY